MGDKGSSSQTTELAPETTGSTIRGWARIYDAVGWLMTFGKASAMRKETVALAQPAAGEKVLDVGCGTGTDAIALRAKVGPGGEVVGIDAAPEMIAVARDKAAKQGADMLVVDDVNARDVHIVDITKPWSPREIAVTGAPDWPSLETLASGASFVHDVWVQENGSQMTAYLSYWDSGLVLLDITDPANPTFMGDSQYIDPDPLSGKPPEGNSHVAVPNSNGSLVIMGDEDFAPLRVIPEITSGPFAGETFNASQGSNVPQVGESSPLVGPTRFVGLACGSAPSPAGAGEIAVIERGACTFTTKAQTVSDAGYVGGIVLNSETGNPPCEAVVSMLAVGDIPFLFVARSSGFKILGITGYDPGNCPGGPNPSLPAAGTASEDVSITAQFDGWGYMRVLDVSNPGSIVELGQFATENVLADPPPPGDHTMHNVIVDGTRAYISWYADGMRVVDFSGCSAGSGQNSCTPTEIAHFVDGGGSNFWGVFLHEIDSTQYILGSDRDSGLWIFETP